MINKNLNIYISTCDKHIHLIKGHQYLFKKFWKNHPKVIVLGYKEPEFELESNYEFVSMGEDRGVEYWATDLRNYFKSIDDTHFIYGMDDHWIPREVDEKVFNVLSEYIEDEKVGRINLTDDTKDRPYSYHDVNNDITIIESDQWMPGESYRISTQYSIWNKEWMLKYLKEGISPWQFELEGSLEANNDGYRVLGSLHEYAMKNMQVVIRGNFDNLNFEWVNDRSKTLDNSIIDDMKKKGIFERENISEDENLVTELRNEIKNLQKIDIGHEIWNENRKELINKILDEDPHLFMTWKVIKDTMMCNVKTSKDELNYLMTNTLVDMKNLHNDLQYKKFIKNNEANNGYGGIEGWVLEDSKTQWFLDANSVHQYYHLYRWEICTSKKIKEMNKIIEIGGGFGQLTRIIHNEGFDGEYIIIDLPEFCSLQKFYLKSCGINTKNIRWVSSINELENKECDLFISTWSLSEMPENERVDYLDIKSKYHLIAFGEYEALDNETFFKEKFVDSYSDVQWRMFNTDLNSNNNNFYLFGKNENLI